MERGGNRLLNSSEAHSGRRREGAIFALENMETSVSSSSLLLLPSQTHKLLSSPLIVLDCGSWSKITSGGGCGSCNEKPKGKGTVATKIRNSSGGGSSSSYSNLLRQAHKSERDIDSLAPRR